MGPCTAKARRPTVDSRCRGTTTGVAGILCLKRQHSITLHAVVLFVLCLTVMCYARYSVGFSPLASAAA